MLGAAIRAILLANSAVYNLVSTRIYPLVLPLQCTFPALTYSFPSDPFKIAMRSARCQISCWDSDYTNREQLRQVVEDALRFYSGSIQGVTIEVIYPIGSYDHYLDSSNGFYFAPIDFKVNYYPQR